MQKFKYKYHLLHRFHQLIQKGQHQILLLLSHSSKLKELPASALILHYNSRRQHRRHDTMSKIAAHQRICFCLLVPFKSSDADGEICVYLVITEISK